jgi:uncharacterized membrane protein YfhO
VFGDKDSVLSFMKSAEFDPQHIVLLEEDPEVPHAEGVAGESTVDIVQYGPNRIEIEVSSAQNGFLVLSENFFPRWHASLDGISSKVYLANYAFRAISVPAGKHMVVFEYKDASFTIGKVLSIIAWSVLIAAFSMQVMKRLRHRKAKKGE